MRRASNTAPAGITAGAGVIAALGAGLCRQIKARGSRLVKRGGLREGWFGYPGVTSGRALSGGALPWGYLAVLTKGRLEKPVWVRWEGWMLTFIPRHRIAIEEQEQPVGMWLTV